MGQHTHMRGFSLIELLVSLALFSIISMISIGTLLALVDANRKAQAVASVTNNLNFALDTMARSVSTGSYYYCGTGTTPGSGWDPAEETRDCTANESNQWLAFIDDDGEEIIYWRESGALWRKKNGTNQRLTAPEVNIEAVGFVVTGTARSGNTVQPTVTIMIQARGGPEVRGVATEYDVQVTVTQRILDI